MSKLKLFTVIASFLVIISTLLGNFYLSAILAFILFLFILVPEYLIPIYYLTSLSGIFIAAPGLGMGRYLGFVLILGIIVRKFKNNEKIRVPYIIILTLILLSSIYSTFMQNAQYSTGFYAMVLNIIMIILFSNFYLTNFDIQQILKSIAFSFSLATLVFSLVIFFRLNNYGLGMQRMTILENLNPNAMAIMCAQMGIYLFASSLVLKNKKRIMITLSVLNIIMVILTGSRSSLFALFLGIMVTYIIFLKVNRVNISKIFKVFIFSLTSIMLFNYILSLNPYLASRMSLESIIETQGAGRGLVIEKLLYEVIPKNLWFGIGLGTENEVVHLSQFFYNPYPSHNFFISMLAQVGLIGLILYGIFLIKILLLGLKNARLDNTLLIPIAMILTGFLNGIGETIFIERWFWNSFALVIFITSNNKKNDEYPPVNSV